jgi:DNA-directed RNA polymerase specialized sigma24 family protein
MSLSDLLHEAVLRAPTGARPCPPSVPLLAFLAGVMRSLCGGQWRHHRRQDYLLVSQSSAGEFGPTLTADAFGYHACNKIAEVQILEGAANVVARLQLTHCRQHLRG